MATSDFADFLLTNAETGEQIVLENVPTGTNGYAWGETGEGFTSRLLPSAAYHPGIWTGDDFFETDFSVAKVGVESKVGGSFTLEQFGKYLSAIDAGISGGNAYRGVITAAHFFFFENPYTDEIVEQSTLRILASEGVSFSVYHVEQL